MSTTNRPFLRHEGRHPTRNSLLLTQWVYLLRTAISPALRRPSSSVARFIVHRVPNSLLCRSWTTPEVIGTPAFGRADLEVPTNP